MDYSSSTKHLFSANPFHLPDGITYDDENLPRSCVYSCKHHEYLPLNFPHLIAYQFNFKFLFAWELSSPFIVTNQVHFSANNISLKHTVKHELESQLQW